MTREYTMKLLDMVDEGILDPKAVMEACLCYMSELQVEDMMRVNDFLLEEEEECHYCGGNCPRDEEHACDGYLGDIDGLDKDKDEAALDDFNYVGSKHHY
jgi:hypothetical protein